MINKNINKNHNFCYQIQHIPISYFDYTLLQDAIAKYPAMPRGTSNLMVVDVPGARKLSNEKFLSQIPANAKDINLTRELEQELESVLEHKKYLNIVDYVKKGDVVVINDVKVVNARLFGTPKGKNSLVEILLLMPDKVGDYTGTRWHALIGGAKKLKNSDGVIEFANREKAKVVDKLNDGRFILEFSKSALEIAKNLGKVPIPKYMHRDAEELDKEYYQTVVAKKTGAIAAPTASLNLTEEMLDKMREKGVKIAYITLYVGWATFAPLRDAKFLDEFKMPPEYVEVSQKTADIVLEAKAQGAQILTFGTTATRTIEGLYTKLGTLKEYSGPVELFISPGYKFKVATSVVTNFHPPLTTPMVLVSAILGDVDKKVGKHTNNSVNGEANDSFSDGSSLSADFQSSILGLDGISKLKAIYKLALNKGYKFYSYGDSMLLRGVR